MYYPEWKRRLTPMAYILLGAFIVATYVYAAVLGYRAGKADCQPAQVQKVTIPPLQRPEKLYVYSHREGIVDVTDIKLKY